MTFHDIFPGQRVAAVTEMVDAVFPLALKGDVYLHCDLEYFWTYPMANADYTEQFGCFGHFLRM